MPRSSSSSLSSYSREKKKKKKTSNRDKDRKVSRERKRSRDRKRSRERKRSRDRKDLRRDDKPKGKKDRKRRSSSSSRRDKRSRRGRNRGRDGRRDRKRNRNDFKFDSKPLEMQIEDEERKDEEDHLQSLLELIPNLMELDTEVIEQKLKLHKVMKQMQQQNADRKLYVSNFGKSIPKAQLVEALNQALKKLGVCQDPTVDPIINAHIDPESEYAFIEFRNPTEAKNGLSLNNVQLFGHPLKISRFDAPEKTNDGIHANSSFLSLLGIGGAVGDHNLLNKCFRITLPTRVIVFINIVTQDDVIIVEEFEDIVQDIKNLAASHGNVLSVVAPRHDDPEKKCPGMGHVFVEFSAVGSAKRCRKTATRKLFRGRRVECVYFNEEQFKKGRYEVDLGYLKSNKKK